MSTDDSTDQLLQRLTALDLKNISDVKNSAELDHAIIEALPFGKVVIDRNGIIVRVNKAAELMFGYSRMECVGHPLEILVPLDLRQKHIKHRDDFRVDTRSRPMGYGLNAHGLRKNGQEFAVNVMLSPFIISTGHYTLAIVRQEIPELSVMQPIEVTGLETAKTIIDLAAKKASETIIEVGKTVAESLKEIAPPADGTKKD